MSKLVLDLKKQVTDTAKRMKEVKPEKARRLKVELEAKLQTTWDAEDALKEAIQKARLSGVTSKKSAVLLKGPNVIKPLKTWEIALKAYHAKLDEFGQFHKDAKLLSDGMDKTIKEAKKATKEVAKGAKKEADKLGGKAGKLAGKVAGGMSSAASGAMLDEAIELAKKHFVQLNTCVEIYGKLPSHVVMYGLNYQRTIEAIMRQAVEAITPRDLPESLTDDQRKKTNKLLKVKPKAIEKLSKGVTKALEIDKKDVAEASFAKMEAELKAIEGLVKDCKTAQSKMKKEIEAHKESRTIKALVQLIPKVYKKCEKMVEDTEKELKTKLDAAT
jgi:hypothetical protein